MLRFRMCGGVTSPPQYAFMLCRLIKHRTNSAMYFNNEQLTLLTILCYVIHGSVCSVVEYIICTLRYEMRHLHSRFYPI